MNLNELGNVKDETKVKIEKQPAEPPAFISSNAV